MEGSLSLEDQQGRIGPSSSFEDILAFLGSLLMSIAATGNGDLTEREVSQLMWLAEFGQNLFSGERKMLINCQMRTFKMLLLQARSAKKGLATEQSRSNDAVPKNTSSFHEETRQTRPLSHSQSSDVSAVNQEALYQELTHGVHAGILGAQYQGWIAESTKAHEIAMNQMRIDAKDFKDFLMEKTSKEDTREGNELHELVQALDDTSLYEVYEHLVNTCEPSNESTGTTGGANASLTPVDAQQARIRPFSSTTTASQTQAATESVRGVRHDSPMHSDSFSDDEPPAWAYEFPRRAHRRTDFSMHRDLGEKYVQLREGH